MKTTRKPLEHDTLTWLLHWNEPTQDYVVQPWLEDWAMHRYRENDGRARGRGTGQLYRLYGIWHYEPRDEKRGKL